jgi:hypothetical protein
MIAKNIMNFTSITYLNAPAPYPNIGKDTFIEETNKALN